MQTKQNLPNAGKLVNSLRSAGYDNIAAICDLIDNGIDAGANELKIDITGSKDDIQIFIGDDGCGMNEEILFEALKLGSITDRNEGSDLGKYGMGLVTASWSFCKNILVISKTSDGEIIRNEIDIDTIIDKNDFVCTPGKASKEEISLFKKYVSDDSGTLIKLSKCDRIQNREINIFSTTLAKRIGQVYRYFIRSGIRFIVNGKKAELIDPLMVDNKVTEIFSDDHYDILFKDTKQKEGVRVKIAILPKFPDKLNDSQSVKINWKNQGFYVLRNNREIASGITLDLFTRHPILNRMRIELFFSGVIDNEMGVNFIKQNLAPNQIIIDTLRQEVKGQIDTIKKRLERESYKSKRTDEILSHDDAEKIIANQAKLLITPEAKIEKRQSSQDRERAKKNIREGKKRLREHFDRVHISKKGLACKFLERSMGEAGPIFEAEQRGKLLMIEWNADHPFYKKFVLANKDNPDLITATDLLVYSMATAELKTFNSDDNFDLLVSYKTVISANLRTLLS